MIDIYENINILKGIKNMTVSELDLRNPEFVGFMSTPEVFEDETDLAIYKTAVGDGRLALCLVEKSRHNDTPVAEIDPDTIEALAEYHEEQGEGILHVDILDPHAPMPAVAEVAKRAVGVNAASPEVALEVAAPPQIPGQEVVQMLNQYLATNNQMAA